MENNIFLGGNEVVFGGWGECEVNTRRIRLNINNNNYDKYYSKKYIYPEDVIKSVLSNVRHKTSYDTINKFIDALKVKESNDLLFDSTLIMPSLTSSKLANFVNEDLYDVNEMQKINLILQDYVNILNLSISLENILSVEYNKEKPVKLSNNKELINLEEKMIPLINIVEKNLAILASNCDKIKNAITRRRETFEFSSDSDHINKKNYKESLSDISKSIIDK